MPTANIIDQYGKPKGYDQTTPYLQRPSPGPRQTPIGGMTQQSSGGGRPQSGTQTGALPPAPKPRRSEPHAGFGQLPPQTSATQQVQTVGEQGGPEPPTPLTAGSPYQGWNRWQALYQSRTPEERQRLAEEQRVANAQAGVGDFQEGMGHIDPRFKGPGDAWFQSLDPRIGEGGGKGIDDPYQYSEMLKFLHSPPRNLEPTTTPPPPCPDGYHSEQDPNGNSICVKDPPPPGPGGGPGPGPGPSGPQVSQSTIAEMPPWEQWSGPSTIYTPEYTPGEISMDRLPTYDPYQYSQTYNPYQYSQDAIPDYRYREGDITQFLSPDQQIVEGQVRGLLGDVMGNRVMSDQVVSQMREQQKEQALAQQEAMLQESAAGAAGRGTFGGGRHLAREQGIRQDTADALLRQSRDLSIQQAQTNRADELAAMDAANQFLTGQAGRAAELFRTGLTGEELRETSRQEAATSQQRAAQLGLTREELQAQEGQQAAKFGLTREELQAQQQQLEFQSRQAAESDLIDRFLQQQQLYQQGEQFRQASAQSALADLLGRGGLDVSRMSQWLDRQGLTERGRQFDENLALQRYLGTDRLALQRERLALDRVLGEQGLNQAYLRMLS